MAALVLALSGSATAQVALLNIQVVEGEGAVHAPGARSSSALTVRVTDESGRPVERAAVSFHLPPDGPSGVFSNGLRTEVVLTGANGMATLRGLRPNRVAGQFQIRILASKEQARAGALCNQYIAGPRSGTAAKARAGRRKWIAVVALAGVGAATGVFAAGRSGSGPSPAPPAPPAIGPPSITVGKP
ncbi:MAG: hypothetical protein LAQ30_07465 [Acidobacteriia bacterium]|nr:hypothetical protein [Terriglobia bacterium]